MTLRLTTAALAFGLTTLLFNAPAEAGGISIRVGDRSCGSRYYHRSYSSCYPRHHVYHAPRRTVVVNRSYCPPPVYRTHTVYREPVRVVTPGYTYRSNNGYYSSSVRHYSHSSPRVVYSSHRGYNRHYDRGYIRTHRGGAVRVNVDFD
jgi:hypothetical protein